MSEASVPLFQVGDHIAHKYRVERLVGRGAMGVVVAATHLELGRNFAIKVLLPSLVQNPEHRERFRREARTSAIVGVRSPHVVDVYDVGRLDDGTPYMVMEYLEGADLKAKLASEGPVDVKTAVAWVLEACAGVAEVHAAGVIHRDLKPSNLFLCKGVGAPPTIKVLDFGVSKIEAPEGTRVTATERYFGSPAYMSPEQIRDAKSVDGRTDVWSLGVILYELLTGVCPFDANSAPALFAKILTERPSPLHLRYAGAPAGLEAVIERCLAKEREARFASVGEFAHALAGFGGEAVLHALGRVDQSERRGGERKGWLETTAPLGSDARPEPAELPFGPTTAEAYRATRPSAKRSPWPFVVIVAFVVFGTNELGRGGRLSLVPAITENASSLPEPSVGASPRESPTPSAGPSLSPALVAPTTVSTLTSTSTMASLGPSLSTGAPTTVSREGGAASPKPFTTAPVGPSVSVRTAATSARRGGGSASSKPKNDERAHNDELKFDSPD